MALEKLDTQIRREQIIEAALGLIAAQGVRQLSVAALARRVGLVPSALYRHFKNKQEIVSAAVEHIRGRVGENLKEVCAATPHALERLEMVMMRVVKMIRELQAMPRIVFAEGVSDQPEPKRYAYEMLKGVLAELESILRQGQERGEVRQDIDAASLAVMFWSQIPALVILWKLSDGRFDVTRQAERSWKLFREVLQAR
jgi:TetR/AcrR family transcriptional regulator, fatty acid metabolism regulator protein